MTAPIKVRVNGEEYEVSAVNELALFPLLRVLGTDAAPEDANSKEYKKWQQKFLGRFADPINQASVAYSLRNLIPDLPESVVRYTLYKEESGDRREDFTLNISAMDLLALMDAITPLLNAKQAEIEGAGKSAPKGFAKPLDTSKAKAAGQEYMNASPDERKAMLSKTAIAPPNVAVPVEKETGVYTFTPHAATVAEQRAYLQSQLASLDTDSEV